MVVKFLFDLRQLQVEALVGANFLWEAQVPSGSLQSQKNQTDQAVPQLHQRVAGIPADLEYSVD